MIGYILTEEQKETIQGQEFAPYQEFNCVQDINDVWFTFISEQQIPFVNTSEFAWVLDCEKGEYIPKSLSPIEE
jgi:hypothetical protein